MKLSSRGRYAVVAMLDLAYHSRGYPVPLANVSVRQGLSLHYLEQLFARLRRKGLVKSVRGPGGGYVLASEPSSITILDVLRAVGEPLLFAEKMDTQEGSANKIAACVQRHVWQHLFQQVAASLASITLAQLCQWTDAPKEEMQVQHNYSFSI